MPIPLRRIVAWWPRVLASVAVVGGVSVAGVVGLRAVAPAPVSELAPPAASELTAATQPTGGADEGGYGYALVMGIQDRWLKASQEASAAPEVIPSPREADGPQLPTAAEAYATARQVVGLLAAPSRNATFDPEPAPAVPLPTAAEVYANVRQVVGLLAAPSPNATFDPEPAPAVPLPTAAEAYATARQVIGLLAAPSPNATFDPEPAPAFERADIARQLLAAALVEVSVAPLAAERADEPKVTVDSLTTATISKLVLAYLNDPQRDKTATAYQDKFVAAYNLNFSPDGFSYDPQTKTLNFVGATQPADAAETAKFKESLAALLQEALYQRPGANEKVGKDGDVKNWVMVVVVLKFEPVKDD